MKEIQINRCDGVFESRFDYRSSVKAKTKGRELLSINSKAVGAYRAEGRGEGLEVGDTLYLTLKGSKDLSLEFLIEDIRYFIEPVDQWQAELRGVAFETLSIFTWQVICDECQVTYPLEFVCNLGDRQEAQVFHARSRLKALKWLVNDQKHVCPTCASERIT